MVLRLFATGSMPGNWVLILDTSLEVVSSSLISGGKSPLAVTIEYCCRLGVIDSSLEISDDKHIGVVSVPLVGTVGTGLGPLKDGIKLENFLGRPRPRFSPRGVSNSTSLGDAWLDEVSRFFLGLPRGLRSSFSCFSSSSLSSSFKKSWVSKRVSS